MTVMVRVSRVGVRVRLTFNDAGVEQSQAGVQAQHHYRAQNRAGISVGDEQIMASDVVPDHKDDSPHGDGTPQ